MHLNDDGLFEKLMGWLEGILAFLRHGPTGGALDINALFVGAASAGQINPQLALVEIDSLVSWQEARKKWHQEKTRQKMAATGSHGTTEGLPGGIAFTSVDFGIEEGDLAEVDYEDEEDSDEDEGDDELDPITAERKRRARRADHLRRSAGEPKKPEIGEVHKLQENFITMLRMVLSD